MHPIKRSALTPLRNFQRPSITLEGVQTSAIKFGQKEMKGRLLVRALVIHTPTLVELIKRIKVFFTSLPCFSDSFANDRGPTLCPWLRLRCPI